MLHSFSWQTPAFLWPTNLQGHTLLENSQTNKQTNKSKDKNKKQRQKQRKHKITERSVKAYMHHFFIMWLNPQAGKMKPIIRSDWLHERSKMGLSCPLGISRVGPARKSSLFSHIINLLLTTH